MGLCGEGGAGDRGSIGGSMSRAKGLGTRKVRCSGTAAYVKDDLSVWKLPMDAWIKRELNIENHLHVLKRKYA